MNDHTCPSFPLDHESSMQLSAVQVMESQLSSSTWAFRKRCIKQLCYHNMMKTISLLAFVLALLCSANAIPSIPNLLQCGNGISCAPSQTCMSNVTGAGSAVNPKTLTINPTPLGQALRVPPFPNTLMSLFTSRALVAPDKPFSQYACSPLSNAVRCNDARFSCPSSTECAEDYKCQAADGSSVDAISNLDAFYDDPMRSFGGMMLLNERWLALLHCLPRALPHFASRLLQSTFCR